MKLDKSHEADYRQTVALSRDDVSIMALRALVSNELEKVKELAITPGGGEAAMLQGQAAAYKTVLKFLTASPVSTKQV